MMVCPNCSHQELSGAIFCSECGAQLISTKSNIATQQIYNIPSAEDVPTKPVRDYSAKNDAPVTLQMETGDILSLAGKKEFTLGRISDNQPIMPDIDLTKFKAYENGVSRLHAVVRLEERRVILMDLGSANGTYVNGIRLTPNMAQQIRHGDTVSIGKLKMQVILS